MTPVELRAAIKANLNSPDPRYMMLTTEPNYYEDLAILCQHKAIDLSIVRDAWGDSITERWNHWRPAIELLRRPKPTDRRDDQVYEHFEWLAGEMKRKPRKSLSAWLKEPAFDIAFD